MESWQDSLVKSITSLEELAEHYPVQTEPLRPVVQRYAMRITLYYFGLIREPGDRYGASACLM